MARRPWFPFYVDDFETDEKVRLMSNEEIGIYVRLLCCQWREGSIPADPGKLARMIGLNSPAYGPAIGGAIGQPLPRLIAVLESCFPVVDNDATRRANKRLLEISDKQEIVHKRLSSQGKKGAQRRWNPDGPAIGGANGPDIAKPDTEPNTDITTTALVNQKVIDPFPGECLAKWNGAAKLNGWKQARMTNAKRAQFKIRGRESNLDFDMILLRAAEQHQFLKGKRWFNIGWLLKNDDHYMRVLEGNYENSSWGGTQPPAQPEQSQQEIDTMKMFVDESNTHKEM